jgi:site-specific DNA recombinase
MRNIAIEFNDAGLRTRNGNRFQISNISNMLRNPAYYGAQVVGRDLKKSKFSKVFSEPTLVNDASHEGIVDKETFQAVQKILSARSGRFRGDATRYLLSGIVFCGHCGRKIYGRLGTNANRATKIYYQCQGVHKAERGARNCVSITGEKLEEEVLNIIKSEVLTDANLLQCEAIYHASQAAEPTLQSDRIASELREKIERGSQNLALAEDTADFTAIAKQLAEWRKELKQVSTAELTPKVQSPFQGLGIENLRSLRDYLGTADRGKLSDAFHQAIQSIVLTRLEPRTHRVQASVLFHPEYFAGGEIVIPEQHLRAKRGWRDIPRFVATLDRPARQEDVMREFGLAQATVSWAMQKCTSAGELSKTDSGWIASK